MLGVAGGGRSDADITEDPGGHVRNPASCISVFPSVGVRGSLSESMVKAHFPSPHKVFIPLHSQFSLLILSLPHLHAFNFKTIRFVSFFCEASTSAITLAKMPTMFAVCITAHCPSRIHTDNESH